MSGARPKLHHFCRLLYICMYMRKLYQKRPPRGKCSARGSRPLASKRRAANRSARVHSCRQPLGTGVCATDPPPDKKTLGSVSLKNTKSAGGERFLLLVCQAKACKRNVFRRHRCVRTRSLPFQATFSAAGTSTWSESVMVKRTEKYR